MIAYIVRRLLWVVVMLFLVSLVTFAVFFLLPSADPALLRAGRQPNPALVAQIRHNLHLDQPYLHYMDRLVLHWDFGYSFQNNIPVKQQIFDRLPATVSLTVGAAVVWLTIGIGVGTLSAVKRRSPFDRMAMTGALIGISAPVYWLGLVSLSLFSNDIGKFKLLPGSGSYAGLTSDPAKWFTSLLMPWFVLAASYAAFYARLLRGNLIDVMSEDYIRTARAKGLTERRVVSRHGIRSAITPIVTALGLDIGFLLGGAILVEAVFNIPGVGRLAFDSIQNSDLPMIQGTVLLGAFFIVLMNLVVDVTYAYLDPRVRLG